MTSHTFLHCVFTESTHSGENKILVVVLAIVAIVLVILSTTFGVIYYKRKHGGGPKSNQPVANPGDDDYDDVRSPGSTGVANPGSHDYDTINEERVGVQDYESIDIHIRAASVLGGTHDYDSTSGDELVGASNLNISDPPQTPIHTYENPDSESDNDEDYLKLYDTPQVSCHTYENTEAKNHSPTDYENVKEGVGPSETSEASSNTYEKPNVDETNDYLAPYTSICKNKENC